MMDLLKMDYFDESLSFRTFTVSLRSAEKNNKKKSEKYFFDFFNYLLCMTQFINTVCSIIFKKLKKLHFLKKITAYYRKY